MKSHYEGIFPYIPNAPAPAYDFFMFSRKRLKIDFHLSVMPILQAAAAEGRPSRPFLYSQ